MMKRVIKFRGKRIDNGEWVYGCYVTQGLCTNGYLCEHGIAPPHCYAFDVDPETVGQFTGLKDKTGQDIYEGDVVNITDGWLLVKHGVVDFDNYAFGYKNNYSSVRFVTMINPQIEVAGNIHDNPELLK